MPRIKQVSTRSVRYFSILMVQLNTLPAQELKRKRETTKKKLYRKAMKVNTAANILDKKRLSF